MLLEKSLDHVNGTKANIASFSGTLLEHDCSLKFFSKFV